MASTSEPVLSATAIAHPNIALIKYWGKRDTSLNLPAVGSISLTLAALHARTTVRFAADLTADAFVINEHPAQQQAPRLSAFLDRIRAIAGLNYRAHVHSSNNFPTGAGLASSASGFAALAVAACGALQLHLDATTLSELARHGSGSAARSIFGGFVEMHHGHAVDGHDAVATPLLAPETWPLTVLVAITSEAEKAVGSTAGMERTRATSPYYEAWLTHQEADLQAARLAIIARDFAALGNVAEHSCFKMHALALAAKPPLLYWNPATIAAVETLWRLRDTGVPVFVTIDAGPQVKAVCLPQARPTVEAALMAVPGVQRVMVSSLGRGAYLEQAGA